MKLVKFSTGHFAIRRWRPWGYEFKSKSADMWWPKGSDALRYCVWGPEHEDLARTEFALLVEKGMPA